jgi:hypothetical protein
MTTRHLSSSIFGDDNAWWFPEPGEQANGAAPSWEQSPVFAPQSLVFAPPGHNSSTSTPGMSLYLTESGDTTAISVNDIHQGQIGDCFLLSPMGEMALWDPSYIQSMIHTNPNGTETVTLYTPYYGAHGLAFRQTAVTVTNSFPTYSVNNGATQDVVSGIKEIWAQVVEKAVAMLGGSYAAIANGGSPVTAMEELTGKPASWYSTNSFSLGMLTADIKAGDLIVMDTANSSSLPYGLVGNHAYMFEGIDTNNQVKLGNPWGSSYNPQLIPFTQLAAAGIVEIDVGHV